MFKQSMETYSLSKSTYIRGLQCLKSLYLNKHRPYLRDKLSEEQLAKFARGHAVGKLAQQLFPGGVEMPRPGKSSATATSRNIEKGVPVIYEACFIRDEVIIALDILVNQPEGWNAYEVKSSGMLSETYFQDAFLQEFVIRRSGLDLKQFFLVHRNPEIELTDNTDLREAFIFRELPQWEKSREEEIRERIHSMNNVLVQSHSPAIAPG